MGAPVTPDDTQLVAGVLAGDREAFATVYDRYGDRLYDFCYALLRDREEAADAVHVGPPDRRDVRPHLVDDVVGHARDPR